MVTTALLILEFVRQPMPLILETEGTSGEYQGSFPACQPNMFPSRNTITVCMYVLIFFSFLVVLGHEGKHILWTFGCQQEISYYLGPMSCFIWNHVGIVSITKSCALKRSILPFFSSFFPLKSLVMEPSAYKVTKCLWQRKKIRTYNFEQLEHYWIKNKCLFLNESPVFEEWALLFPGIWCQQYWTLWGVRGLWKFSEYHWCIFHALGLQAWINTNLGFKS